MRAGTIQSLCIYFVATLVIGSSNSVSCPGKLKKKKKKKVMLLLLDQIKASLSSSEPSASNGSIT